MQGGFRRPRALNRRMLPLKWQTRMVSIMGSLFADLNNDVGLSGLPIESADGQSVIWEIEYEDVPGASMRITHSLVEVLPQELGFDVLQEHIGFELLHDGTVYGTNHCNLGGTAPLFLHEGFGIGISAEPDWSDILDPDLFSDASLVFQGAGWSQSPEYTPYVTHP